MKQAVVGYGKAEKMQVQEMVKRLLNLPTLPGKDAADALGLAISHANSSYLLNNISKSDAGLRKTSAMFKAGRTY
jgi:crossover junction endodeoxyribonuclease RuvC